MKVGHWDIRVWTEPVLRLWCAIPRFGENRYDGSYIGWWLCFACWVVYFHDRRVVRPAEVDDGDNE